MTRTKRSGARANPDGLVCIHTSFHRAHLFDVNYTVFNTFYEMTSQLPPRRRAIKTPIGVAAVVPLSLFLECALPPLSHGLDAEHVVKKLHHTGKNATQRPITQQGRWRGLAHDPASSPHPIKTLFTHLGNAFKSIVQSGKPGDKDLVPHLKFCWSDEGASSVEKSSLALPDVYLSFGHASSWTSIAVCGECQKTDSEKDVHDVSPSFAYQFRKIERAVEHPEGDV